MAHTKHSHKSVSTHWQIPGSIRNLIRFDTWRWIDLGLVVASIGFLITGRFTFLPFVFILLTVIEVLFEIAIRRSNREWQNTVEGENWVRRMTAASRLFFIPAKSMVFLIALFLLIMRW